MEELQRRQHIKKTFDTVCEGYDCTALRFFNRAAENLPRLFNLKVMSAYLMLLPGLEYRHWLWRPLYRMAVLTR